MHNTIFWNLLCVEYLATWVKIVSTGLIICKVHSHTYETNHHQQVQLPLSLYTPPNISSHIFTPNKPPMLTQQLIVDYILNQNAWNEIMTKLNKMAKENRLIKPSSPQEL